MSGSDYSDPWDSAMMSETRFTSFIQYRANSAALITLHSPTTNSASQFCARWALCHCGAIVHVHAEANRSCCSLLC